MRLEFLENGPALVVENSQRVLVIADLHFGIESDLARHGLHFQSRTIQRRQRMVECIRETCPDMLVLLGDIKHGVPQTSRQEYRELPEVLQMLRDLVPVRVIPGNHDVGIGRFLEDGELLPMEGALIDGTGYLHGHTYPHNSLAGHLLICGHHHPVVALRDEVGFSLRAPAFFFCPLDDRCLHFPAPVQERSEQTRLLLVPAFNEISGYDLARTIRDPFSPVSRCMQIEESEIFLTDGTYLGPVSVLEDYGDARAS